MVKINNLNKYFNLHSSNQLHVINDTTVEFPQNGLITILGESGSGKTTLMNVIGGLDKFDSGSITIDDYVITKYRSRIIDRIRNENIGYIFQNYLLLTDRTVYYNLLISLNMYNLTLKEKEERIDYTLKAVDMLRYKKRRVSELSGGQQQRVSIARALIKTPKMILADEPTGNLDEKNTIGVMNIIKKISKNTLIILISHEKNIALTYSDRIIEISDGKIVSDEVQDNNILYQYENDQTLYLKEYVKKEIQSDDNNVKINYYSNSNELLELNIIFENGKFFLQSNENIKLVTKDSEIKIKDDERKKFDIVKEMDSFEYDLNPLEYKRNPKLSFKEIFNLSINNKKTMQKRSLFLYISLFLIAFVTLFLIQNIIEASKIDYQHLTSVDSRVLNVDVENASVMDVLMRREAFDQIYDKLLVDMPNVNITVPYTFQFIYNISGYSQITSTNFRIDQHSLTPIDFLDEKDIIYGRMSKNINEIVVDKWVLENAMADQVVSNFFQNVQSYLNTDLSLIGFDPKLKIVGICETNQNVIYMNKWQMINLFPSDLKKNRFVLLPYSELIKYDESYNNYNLKDNEYIELNDNAPTFKFNGKYFQSVGKISNPNIPYKIVCSDNIYNQVLKESIITNGTQFSFFVKDKIEENQIKDYFSNLNTKYTIKSGIEVEVQYRIYSKFLDSIQEAIIENEKIVNSRLLIVITIFITSFLIIFFTMKSYTIKNIYEISVYRAIGIKKSSIIYIYGLEILFISLQTTLTGSLICYIVSNILTNVPLIEINYPMSFALFSITSIVMILINILIGMLPISLSLRYTPSQLMTKYDI